MTDNTPSASSRSWIARHSAYLFVGGFGLVFTVGGLLLLLVAVPPQQTDSATLDALAVVSPLTSPGQPDGTRVLLEARIASDTPERFRDFVAYQRREFRGWKEDGARRREQWATTEVVTPALVLGEPPHRVTVASPDYELALPPHTWQSGENLVYLAFGEKTQGADGFRRGDAVTADGVLERGPQGRAIRITTLAGGSAAAYRDSRRRSVQDLLIVGRIFAAVGATLCVTVLVVGWRRAR